MVAKRIMAIRDRESSRLETVPFARRIFLLECFSRYVSHMTKSFLLQFLNLKQNVTCKICRSCQKTISDTVQISRAHWLEVAIV